MCRHVVYAAPSWRVLAATLLLSTLLAACTPFAVLNPSGATDHRYIEVRESLICGASLDRGGLGAAGPSPLASDPAIGPVAGFSTRFTPGQPPFACDRLHTFVKQGVTKFDVQARLDLGGRRLKSAWLDIVEFTPEGSVALRDGVPWDGDFGVGVLVDTSSIRDSCQFTVRLSDVAWPPPSVDSALRTRPLPNYVNPDELQFSVPVSGSRPRFVVTSAVQRWLAGEPEFGFVIEPTDPAMRVKSNSRCRGLFHVQLRIYAEE